MNKGGYEMGKIKLFIAGIAGVFTSLLGGYDIYLKSLLIFMLLDYVLGLTVASLGRSKNSEQGGLSSSVGWFGLIKKLTYLTLIIIAIELDILLGLAIVRQATIIFFIINELISITENIGLLGVKLPPVILKAIDLLENESEKKDDL